MCSNSLFSRKYALSILTGIVLCSIAFSSACKSNSKKQNDNPAAEDTQAAVKPQHDHPNTAEGTQAPVKEIVAVLEKSLAGLPAPASAPPACESELTKLREVLKTAPATRDAETANSALLRCTSLATNETNCKGKPQPCGVVYYNPPIKQPGPGQPGPELSQAKAVDVSAPEQIAAACSEIAGSATGLELGSLAGNYSCAAWFKAAASNDPTLLIGLGFAPTTRLVRDLNTYTNGVVDVTPEAVLANRIERVNFTLVTMRVGGAIVPVAVLPVVPVGVAPGQVLDGAHKAVKERVTQVAAAVEAGCKLAGICH